MLERSLSNGSQTLAASKSHEAPVKTRVSFSLPEILAGRSGLGSMNEHF